MFPEPLIFAPFASCTLGTYGAVVALRRIGSEVCSCVEYLEVPAAGLPVSGNPRQVFSAFRPTGCAVRLGEVYRTLYILACAVILL